MPNPATVRRVLLVVLAANVTSTTLHHTHTVLRITRYPAIPGLSDLLARLATPCTDAAAALALWAFLVWSAVLLDPAGRRPTPAQLAGR